MIITSVITATCSILILCIGFILGLFVNYKRGEDKPVNLLPRSLETKEPIINKSVTSDKLENSVIFMTPERDEKIIKADKREF